MPFAAIKKETKNDPSNHHFGKCWKNYLEQFFSETRVNEARKSILDFLDRSHLQNVSMIDIGCGSGLFSYAAYQAGASPLYSLDYDPLAVECALSLWEREGKPQDWHIQQASILEDPKKYNLPQAELVYAWGTLQHTGNMWLAFRNAAELIKPGGLFYVAVYNEVPGIGPRSSSFWIKIKKNYSKMPYFLQEIGFWIFKFLFFFWRFIRFQKTTKPMRRGMDQDVNLRAWLGAWPCEFSSSEKVIRFCEQELKLRAVKKNLTNRLANNEFLFQKPAL